MNYDDPVIFDFETTSLDLQTCEVIQIAALAPKSNDKFEVKIEFDINKAEKSALDVNGYSRKVWKEEAISRRDGFEKFFKFLKTHASEKKMSKRNNPFYVAVGMGFNVVKFDMAILVRLAELYRMFIPMDYRPYDILQLALWELPGLESYSLKSVAEYFKCYRENHHEALADVETTADVAACLLYDSENPKDNLKWVKRRYRRMVARREEE